MQEEIFNVPMTFSQYQEMKYCMEFVRNMRDKSLKRYHCKKNGVAPPTEVKKERHRKNDIKVPELPFVRSSDKVVKMEQTKKNEEDEAKNNSFSEQMMIQESLINENVKQKELLDNMIKEQQRLEEERLQKLEELRIEEERLNQFRAEQENIKNLLLEEERLIKEQLYHEQIKLNEIKMEKEKSEQKRFVGSIGFNNQNTRQTFFQTQNRQK